MHMKGKMNIGLLWEPASFGCITPCCQKQDDQTLTQKKLLPSLRMMEIFILFDFEIKFSLIFNFIVTFFRKAPSCAVSLFCYRQLANQAANWNFNHFFQFQLKLSVAWWHSCICIFSTFFHKSIWFFSAKVVTII